MLNRLIMIDRDGTLIRSSTVKKYLCGDDPFEVMPGAARCIRSMQDSGSVVAVCTNQQGVALDEYPDMTERSVQEFHERLNRELANQNVLPLEFCVCPHADDAECSCRKPRPGLLYSAMVSTESRTSDAWFVGDVQSDVIAAQRAGVQPILLLDSDTDTIEAGTIALEDWAAIEKLYEMGIEKIAAASLPNDGTRERADALTLNAEAYDSVVPAYVEKTERFGSIERLFLQRQLTERLADCPSKMVLDLGCGPARDLNFHVDNGWFYLGVDSSKEMLREAASHCLASATRDWALVNSDFLQLQFPPRSLGWIIANSSIQHIRRDDLRWFLKRAADWLINGGLIYLHFRIGTGERIEESYEYTSPDDGIARFFVYYEQDEIVEMLNEAGLKVVETDVYTTDYELDDPHKKEMVPEKARVVATRV